MKCPKCGYNSFEFLDACKKCGSELGSFKKTHRINTVLRKTTTVAAVLPQQAQAAAQIATQVAVQEENLHESFNLGFPESPLEEVKDTKFSGFSFDDEPAPPAQPANETLEDDFSFGEPAEEEPKSSSWDIQFDETGSGLDDYERILAPDSIAKPADSVQVEALDLDSFGTSDFDFAPEQSREDIFGMENELDNPISPEKKPQPNLEDFDKEFEMIFAEEDSTDSGEKTS